MRIKGLDYVVLTVRNIGKTIEFYQSVLGMEVEEFGQGRKALKFGQQKLNLHQYGCEFEPKAANPFPGSQDYCFITDTKFFLALEHVKGLGVEILQGPVSRTGAVGAIISFYFRDPDNNLIEVASYPRV